MLGKQRTRVSSFSMLHATALIAALGVAALIGPSIEHAGQSASSQVTRTITSDAAGPYTIIRATVVRFWECDEATKDVDV